jgi:4-amino-4-deoxy-L-arabinose transferase-like glycosyltransferase
MEQKVSAQQSARDEAQGGESRSAAVLSPRRILPLCFCALAGALLTLLVFQIPARHDVDIGGYDAAYVQGFHDPEAPNSPFLAGSDGGARWTRDVSYLLFPQAGLPAEATLRLRGRPGEAGTLTILLNDQRELARVTLSDTWQEVTVAIDDGLLKPSDVVLALRGEARPLSLDRPQPVTALIDRVTYRAGPPPILPYPWPVAYTAVAAALLWALLGAPEPLRRRRAALWGAGMAVIALALLLCYRLQPPFYPYPLRTLPLTVCGALASLLALRHGPALTARYPALLDAAAIAGMAGWTLLVLQQAREHLVLSLPGVENDFRVFALRSERLFGVFSPDGVYNEALDGVLRADGFYNLGYPLLLWLVRPLTSGNPFLAAQVVAALSGALLLAATWWAARHHFGRSAALIALGALASSAFVVQYALYLGTDMLFAALCALTLALLLATPAARSWRWAALAGLTAGAAFLVRHPGILLLPVGLLALRYGAGAERRAAPLLAFAIASAIAILPQVAVNVRDTGQPLYSQQAKNIWLAVYADGDWRRWGGATNDVPLTSLIARDPLRFAGNWWANVRGFFGAGAENTSEFGRADQVRLLGFPANWLAIAGLLGWIGLLFTPAARRAGPHLPLLSFALLYVAGIAVGLSLPRFYLPLVAVYAIAAAWAAARLAERLPWRRAGLPLIGIALALALTDGFRTGAAYVLGNQNPDERAAVQLVQATLAPGERLVVDIPPRVAIGKYSAIAHRIADLPITEDAAALRAAGVAYLLVSNQSGPPPAWAVPAAAVNGFRLYRVE